MLASEDSEAQHRGMRREPLTCPRLHQLWDPPASDSLEGPEKPMRRSSSRILNWEEVRASADPHHLRESVQVKEGCARPPLLLQAHSSQDHPSCWPHCKAHVLFSLLSGEKDYALPITVPWLLAHGALQVWRPRVTEGGGELSCRLAEVAAAG